MIEVFCVEGEGGDETVHPFVKQVMGVSYFFFVGFRRVTDDKIVACVGGDLFNPREHGADKLTF